MKYNWQQKDWPHFTYQTDLVEDILFAFAEETGHVSGMLKAMPEQDQTEVVLSLMVDEALKTSEIEGEYLKRQDVVSSIRNNLGLNKPNDKIKDKKAKGAGELMVAVRKTFEKPLTELTLFEWHAMLLESNQKINVGKWRTHHEPMQVVSGSVGKETIHFEAPPSNTVPNQMQDFIKWFNDTAPGGSKEIKKAPIRSAIAHLYFESIHPFEDGNGRIGRAIAEKALSQTIGRPVVLSLSQTIEANKMAYYKALENGQRNNEITDWVIYFVRVVFDAQVWAKNQIDFILKKAKFFDRYLTNFNERQLKAVRKMLDVGPSGYEGGMTAKKYIAITKASKATATRDLQLLAEMGVFKAEGGGRNTHYVLVI